jgi:cytochrome P450
MATDAVPRDGNEFPPTGAQAVSLSVFNPLDPDFKKDPYSRYNALRQAMPVLQTPLGSTLFSRYDDCVEILKDHHRFSSDFRKSRSFELMAEQLQNSGIDIDPTITEARPFLFLDPPEHTRLRGLVQKAFTPKVVESLKPRIELFANELLEAAAERGHMDAVEDFAYPLPVQVICEMLGVPPSDNALFKNWSKVLARSIDPDFFATQSSRLDPPREVIEARASFAVYFSNLIDDRSKNLGDDLLSGLIVAEHEGHKLTRAELISTAILLLIAGHETTVSLISKGILQFLRHPDQLDDFVSDTSVAKSAIEEVLRYDPPVHLTARVALEDVEIGGTVVEKGNIAVALIAAANRDPAHFENPDVFDIRRGASSHIAFGFGIHHCLGAPLARLEGRIALSALFARFPNLELAGEAVFRDNFVLHGLEHLPVGWGN